MLTVLGNPLTGTLVWGLVGASCQSSHPREVMETSVGCTRGPRGGTCHLCSVPAPAEPHPRLRLQTCPSDHKVWVRVRAGSAQERRASSRLPGEGEAAHLLPTPLGRWAAQEENHSTLSQESWPPLRNRNNSSRRQEDTIEMESLSLRKLFNSTSVSGSPC